MSLQNVYLSLNEKSSGYEVFRRRLSEEETPLYTKQDSHFVSEGTKFTFSPLDGTLTARGPLTAPLSLSLALDGSDEVKYWVEVSYAMSEENDPLFSSQRSYEWVAQGWSKCSRDCGGGKQHVLLRLTTLV